jgi:hypothetical protein
MHAAMKLARTMHRLSAVTQNQPLRVEIKGFKTGNYLGVKTTLVGPITAGSVLVRNFLVTLLFLVEIPSSYASDGPRA